MSSKLVSFFFIKFGLELTMQTSDINITGAMMNPLLAVVVNFQCLTNVELLIEHALFYWIGPLIVELTLSLSLKTKQKTD